MLLLRLSGRGSGVRGCGLTAGCRGTGARRGGGKAEGVHVAHALGAKLVPKVGDAPRII